jgi:transcriptional regulator with XRE-family HTH domain
MTNNKKRRNLGSDFLDELLKELNEEEIKLNDFMVDTAVQLRRMRIARGFTQLQAAEMCGISQVMVSKLESGDYNPSIEVLWNYVHSLGGIIETTISISSKTECKSCIEDKKVIKFKGKESSYQTNTTDSSTVELFKWRA